MKGQKAPVRAAIVGWAHTRFGRLTDATVESLAVTAARDALAHAGIDPRDIDEILLGHYNGGLSRQDFTAALALGAHPALRFKPATRVENACASGAAAVHQGIRAIEARRARIVLVVGVEKMTDSSSREIGEYLLRAAYIAEESAAGGFAALFGQVADRYFARYGDQSDALALIAAKNHANGCHNPLAQIRKDLGYDFCRTVSDQNPLVTGPLKRTDCSPVSDGAAALLIASVDAAVTAPRAVGFRGIGHAQEIMPMSQRDIVQLDGCRIAWAKALGEAGLSLANLSFAETHDCFTIAELIEYEAMGLVPEGQGARAISEGWTMLDGKLPINTSGGLKAKGHPIGATGVSMHAFAAMQLCNQAPAGIQVRHPTIGGVFNMGGVGVANYVSILERVR